MVEDLREIKKLGLEFELLKQVLEKLGGMFEKLAAFLCCNMALAVPISHGSFDLLQRVLFILIQAILQYKIRPKTIVFNYHCA